jgi:hypothetical protein
MLLPSGRRFMGQGGTAVTGTLVARRSRGPVHSSICPDRALAGYGGVVSRADQASSRAHSPTHPCQRVCCRRNQGGCGAGALLIEQAKAVGEPPEDPLLLFSVLYVYRWTSHRPVVSPEGRLFGRPRNRRALNRAFHFLGLPPKSRDEGRIRLLDGTAGRPGSVLKRLSTSSTPPTNHVLSPVRRVGCFTSSSGINSRELIEQ